MTRHHDDPPDVFDDEVDEAQLAKAEQEQEDRDTCDHDETPRTHLSPKDRTRLRSEGWITDEVFEDERPKRDKRPWMICTRCEGEGKIVHPACSVWTGEDIAEDPESFEEMMRGTYDVPCPECHGQRVIKEPTEEEIEDAIERANDRRTRAAENGDWEAYHNPDIARHYY